MSQSQQQQTQKQPQQQKPEGEQTKTACKNRKRKNRRKRSEGSGPAEKCEPKEILLAGAGGDTKMEKKPLNTSMEQLQVAPRKPTTPIASRKAAGSNWEAVVKTTATNKPKTNNEQENVAAGNKGSAETTPLSKSAKYRQKRRNAEQKYVSMDCEMVGVGLNGQDDMLARVSIVNKRGEVLLDKFVKPQEKVTDYRTSVSGIRPHDIDNAEDFKSVQEEVVQMLQGKILVGHAIRNDLAVLHIKHPNSCIRDTSRYKPLCRLVANGRTPSLKRLSQAILGKEIQTGEHNSVEDARAAMSIYNCLASDWEMYIKRHQKGGK
ncbi:RNA exonuclease 4 [Lucilia sericata]|uniref:RNA exonuclease 4 n=1 Tax=Lucilia sericata TaxID=13632 RepID=UPI0018A875F2|nr:RNA exonuclease 4 [Lucilia sericata]